MDIMSFDDAVQAMLFKFCELSKSTSNSRSFKGPIHIFVT